MGRGETSHRLEAIAHRPIASDLGLQAGTQQAGVLRRVLRLLPGLDTRETRNSSSKLVF